MFKKKAGPPIHRHKDKGKASDIWDIYVKWVRKRVQGQAELPISKHKDTIFLFAEDGPRFHQNPMIRLTDQKITSFES